MNAGNDIMTFLETTAWIRCEIRKATVLPAREMVPRIQELLARHEHLSREVTQFLNPNES
jgi:hypothetical protein